MPAPPRILFVTGRLAEFALRHVVEELAARAGFEARLAVLPISVAALMPPRWVARHLEIPEDIDRIILPGHCKGDLGPILEKAAGRPVERGPEDLRDLPLFFGDAAAQPANYGDFDIEILAEINHAPALTIPQILAAADHYRAAGADVIDVGCDPGGGWSGVADAVKALRAEGHRVSIDSFDTREIERAVAGGAELVLSVNATNRAAARDWDAEVVAIPDLAEGMLGLETTVEDLQRHGVRFRIDPVLEPVGFGFAKSLGRYLDIRRKYPEAPLLMGVGNLTELTDADSAGINVLLLGFCQEIGVRSVLTTQVINWAQSSVRELDLARRLVYHSVQRRTLPKHLEPRLVMLRDPRAPRFGPDTLRALADRVKDPNWRIFAEDCTLYAFNGQNFLTGDDPFELFERMNVADPSHAFYLGYELAKAQTALTLGKAYRQDQALRWGFLTQEERSHRAIAPDSPEE